MHLPFIAHEIIDFDGNQSLMVSDNGAYLVKNHTDTIPFKRNVHSLFSAPQRQIKPISSQYIIGTESQGAFIFKDSISLIINQSKGLLDDHITDIAAQNDSTVWISTYKGLNKIQFNQNFTDFTIQAITKEKNGLISNEISGIGI